MRWPVVGPVVPLVLSPWFSWPFSQGTCSTSANASATWGTANLARYFPVWIPEAVIITKLWWQNGATATGNIDCGIYDDQGNRIVSTGSTAQSGTSVIQAVDITDTLIPAGLLYFALAANSASATFWTTAAGPSGSGLLYSAYQQTSAFALPNPATFASTAGADMSLRKFGALVLPRTVL